MSVPLAHCRVCSHMRVTCNTGGGYDCLQAPSTCCIDHPQGINGMLLTSIPSTDSLLPG